VTQPGEIGIGGGRGTVTVPGAGQPVGLTVVRVVAEGGGGGVQVSPYNANPFDTVVCDTSLGNIVVNLPALASGQWVSVIHDSNTSLASNHIVVNGPSGVNIAEPPPNNGSFAADVVISGSQSSGTSLTWFNGGSAGGLLLE
jgi:glycine cleavage system pyridoxal-binding protein P